MKTAETPQDWTSLAPASSNSNVSSDSSANPDLDETLASTLTKSARRRIFFASFAGTMVEWYDFFLYGFIAPLVFATLLFGILVFGMGGYIAYAGRKIRHREFRNVPPPKVEAEEEH